jgi:glycine cleavage system T protein (aminomethyltransferase)
MLRTPLTERHRDLGARLVEFSGWEMPLQYRGILEEHRAVRERAGLFDLSHMGELWVSGPGAAAGLGYALVTDPGRLAMGRAQYSVIVQPDGGIVDDLIVYRTAPERFLLVPNASNAETVADEVRARLDGFDAALDDATRRTALIALQGPRALDILGPLTDVPVGELRYYAIAEGHAVGLPAWVARTGYTGEDGFELFLDWDDAPAAWDRLIEAGQGKGLVPAGLGARDTLRLEAGMALYGNELDRDTDPFEAGLGRMVKVDKEADYVGREALTAAAAGDPERMLVGLTVRGRGIARHGHELFRPGESGPIGLVTSGTASPTLGVPIAMGYLPPGDGQPGTMVEVGIRDGRVAAEVVELPFYQRPRARPGEA